MSRIAASLSWSIKHAEHPYSGPARWKRCPATVFDIELVADHGRSGTRRWPARRVATPDRVRRGDVPSSRQHLSGGSRSSAARGTTIVSELSSAYSTVTHLCATSACPSAPVGRLLPLPVTQRPRLAGQVRQPLHRTTPHRNRRSHHFLLRDHMGL